MTTYSIREFKAQVSAILRNLDNGEEVIITRRGKPCGKLIPVPHPPAESKPQRRSLLGLYADRLDLPDFTYQDFQDIKAIWEPRPLPADTHTFHQPR